MGHYYTYAYLRKDKTPYYIGKGKEGRIYSTQKRIKPPKDKSLIIFLKQNLTEEEAFEHEIYMIAILGRKDLGTGILRNLTNGGEGITGGVRSAETKKKMSEAHLGEKNPMFGMTGEKNHLFGKVGALHPTSKAVIAIKPDGTKQHFSSGYEAARELKIHKATVCRCLKTGKSLTRGEKKGWQLRYA